ncbi:MAG: hypothetical protein ABIP55_02465 [Tepidisphaeraceae bacterium]
MEDGARRARFRAILHPLFSIFVPLSSMLVFAVAGCSVLGIAAYKIAGPPAVPAQYVPARTPMLILVENFQYQTSAAAPSDVLARYIAADLQKHNVAPLIPLEKLQAMRDAGAPEYTKMSITAIGRELGAAQILYVQLHSSDVTPLSGGEALHGQAAASVKVVDVATGQNLWPTDIAGGHVVAAKAQASSSRQATPADVHQQLTIKLTEQISRLFYKWKPDDMAPQSEE